jgi:hypothetical protein
MSTVKPIFDPTTRYQVTLRGSVDLDWLQSFDSSLEISLDEAGQAGEITVLYVQTDQSGIVGLLRNLHGLGMAILKVDIITRRD